MMGQSNLTWQIDAYSFGICCIEILMKGGIPWPLNDDDTVRHFVLGGPSLPPPPLLRV
jgi:abelson tyrosine-protein kinase 1